MEFDVTSVLVVGAGLAGAEAAMQLARAGIGVRLFEMKPTKFSPAHQSENCAELVCSNSFKSQGLEQASGLLQEELVRLGSLVMASARMNSVAAGQALAVEREGFSAHITRVLQEEPLIELVRGEVVEIPDNCHTIVATGPLGSPAITSELARLTGERGLYFYDAMAPIVDGESIDRSVAYLASRYDKGGDDYLNCPFDREEFDRFFAALTAAEKVPTQDFEDEKVFNACQPIETLAASGDKTLRFGPMKPVGLVDPRTGRRPWAVVQLRREDAGGGSWNLVGFQTKLTHPEQERVFRLIPGLKKAVFNRLGSLHRNTYVDGPKCLDPYLRLRKYPWIQLAGQITGVEGYLESAATGLWAGRNLALRLNKMTPDPPPRDTALGSLIAHVYSAPVKKYEPMNMNFGLLPPLGINMRDKAASKRARSQRALDALQTWLEAQKEGAG